MNQKILVINGPNLNLLGTREKEKYGQSSLEDIRNKCEAHAKKIGLEVEFKQSNVEGEIVNFIQETRKKYNGIIINAGGYTHTSVAILDALLAVKKPTIELHITNIYKREDFRHKSLISKAADGIICGLGADGYIMALNGIKKIINNEN
jgi:3-dehydroquinate dehydratase-2